MTTANTAQTKATVDFSWKAASSILQHIKVGSLRVNFAGESWEFGQAKLGEPNAEVTVHDSRLLRDMLTGGSLAAAEGYIEGLWDTPDLTQVVQLFAANLNETSPNFGLKQAIKNTAMKAAHWLNRNTLKGSRKNIQAHYDLGNDLFTEFLDESMMYSSAIYPTESSSLEQAQHYRLNRICQKLQLGAENHLLEIGTGWGSMAIHAAKYFGCQVTTTTISDEQFAYAQRRIKEEGLEDKITLLKKDYRLLTGKYDRLVSIEMIEAVGHKFLPSYFSQINNLLSEDGIALLQSITIPDQRYKAYKNSVDFIRKYIFPGGHLPSISMINQQIAEHTNMTVSHFEDITGHYAKTLRDWDKRFVENYPKLDHSKYNRQFYRMWRYYFAYCEGGFIERAIGTSQIVFSKPRAKFDWVINS